MSWLDGARRERENEQAGKAKKAQRVEERYRRLLVLEKQLGPAIERRLSELGHFYFSNEEGAIYSEHGPGNDDS